MIQICRMCCLDFIRLGEGLVIPNTVRVGQCARCKESHVVRDVVPFDEADTPLPRMRSKARRYSPVPVWFGWSLVLMALALALAVLLMTQCAHAATNLEAWTQSAIRQLPTFHEDVTSGGRSEAKEAQLTLIASEVAKASRGAPLPPRQWAALLLTIGFHESAFSLRIHAGDCKPKECDRGKARSPWQLHQNNFNRESWELLVGVENTRVQVLAANELLRRVSQNCVNSTRQPTVPGILTAYAGRRCFQDWPGLNARLATFGSLRP